MIEKYIKKEQLIEKVCLLFVLAFVFLTMYYYDNQTAFIRIQDNMGRILDGKWYYFFNGWFAIPYGIMLQMMCAIWALPVFILSRFGIITTTCVGARLWYKIFVLIFLALDTWQLGMLAENVGISTEKKKWIQLFFLSSLLVMLPAVHIAQFDAVYLFFILLGINYYLNKEHYKFLISFTIAIPGKFIPLFIFIPLVLLNEKRYLYIVRDFAVGCILVVVDRLMNSIGYRIENYLGIDPTAEIYTNTTMQENFTELLHSNFQAFNAQMSIIVLCFSVLCIWCYMKDRHLRNELAVYVSFIGFAMLFAFGCATPYWIILQMPFTLILMFKSDEHYRILFPMELIFTLGFIYTYIIVIPWIFGSEDTFSFLLFSLLPGYADNIHGFVSDFLKVRNLTIYDGAISAVMVASLVGYIIAAYPLKNVEDKEIEISKRFVKGWYWVRLAVAVGWILLNIRVVFLNHIW